MDCTKRSLFVFAILCSVGTGCIETDDPLTDPAGSTPDAALLGHWMVSDPNSESHFFVGRHKAKEVFEVTVVAWDPVQQKVESNDSSKLYFTTSKFGDLNYMSILGVAGSQELAGMKGFESYKKWSNDANRRAIVIRYEIRGNNLDIWQSDSVLAERLVSEGELKPIDPGNIKSAKALEAESNLSDRFRKMLNLRTTRLKSVELRNYLQKEGGGKLFTATLMTTLTKTK